jgi:hypothetical protein
MEAGYKKICITISFISLILNGCTPAIFKKIQTFSRVATEIDKHSSAIANDIYESCLRAQVQYNNDRFFDYVENREAKEEECEQDKQIRNRVGEAYSVLTGYMMSLGNLAGKDSTAMNNNLEDIGGSLKSLNLNSQRVDAGIAIAQLLSDIWTRQFKRDNLKKAIVCTNQPIQDYIKGLIEITEEYYINGVLPVEAEKIKGYYTKFGPLPPQGIQPPTFFELEQSYNEAMNAVKRRRDAAHAFIKTLQETAQSHEKLKDEFLAKEKNTTTSVDGTYCGSLKDTSRDARPLNLEDFGQIERINTITEDYIKAIEPHLQKMK